MKPLLLNTFDRTGGAARASFRLMQGLVSLGVDAHLLVREKTVVDSAVLASGALYGGRMRAILDYLPVKFYSNRQLHNFSLATVPSHAAGIINDISPDIIHLHWIPQGFISIGELSGLSVPIVWTMHDSWPFTGGCHLPGECCRYQQSCGCCPVLGSRNERDLSRRVWQSKRRNYPVGRMSVVAPSLWMAARVKTSSLFQGCTVEVIPNGVDVECYSPGDKVAARMSLGLPLERKIILFGAKNVLSDPNKGADLLWKALAQLPAGQRRLCTLVLFGEEPDIIAPPIAMEIISCGVIDDESKLADLYRAADVFIMTSRQENLPSTISEAMACGLPCVAFGVGGIPEQIVHRRTGGIAQPYDTEALSAEIAWLLGCSDVQNRLSAQAREHAVAHYALDHVARKHLELYQGLVD